MLMTPKQQLLAHLETQHDDRAQARLAHQRLVLRHKDHHDRNYYLTHRHQPAGWTTGGEQIPVRIFLSPPKNPSSNSAKDRNWVLNVAHKGGGYRYEMPGTSVADPEGAQDAADAIIGYAGNWVAVGWGFQHTTKEKIKP
jgi:hypothetical protein